MLNRNRYRLPTSVKILIYHSLFASHINYTHLVWGTTTESNLRKIHLLQKKIIRIIANVPYHNHTEHLFKHYNIPTIYSLYNRSLLRIWHSNLSSENSVFNEIACLQKNTATYITRHGEYWSIPPSRTNYGLQMTKNKLPRLLNSFHDAGIDIINITRSELLSLIRTFS